MTSVHGDPGPLMKPGQVARAFGVDPKTVTRWAQAGKLTVLWTPAGHRRYRATEVRAWINGGGGAQ